MRIVFMGTPQLAAMMMEELASRLDVVLAVTRPDAVSGRGAALRPSAVRATAERLGIPVALASKIDNDVIERIKCEQPDAICVAAFGCLLPDDLLELPRLGCLNVHMSLLPRWRGAAPLERAILAGDEKIGFSVMRMEHGLDTGPYCMQVGISAESLYLNDFERRFAKEGADALCVSIEGLDSGSMEWEEQDSDCATYAAKIGKDELAISPELPAAQIYAHVRASSDAHPARCIIAERKVTVERLRPVVPETLPVQDFHFEEGFAYYIGKRLYLSCSDGLLEVEALKPSGKNSMDGKAFAAGIQNFKKEPKPWGGIL